MSRFLSKRERASLLAEHRLERDSRFSDRIKTILLLDDGESYEAIAKFLFIDDATVRRYFKLYQKQGLEGLLALNHLGSQSKLSDIETSELREHLNTKAYSTTSAIAEHVKSQYGILYSTRGMHHLLIRLGFVYKKTKAVPGKADVKAQEKFLAMYQHLLEHKPEEDPVYFVDGVHAQHNSHPSYCWIYRGKEKQIATNTGRKRVNINGALNAETLEVITRSDPSINAQSTVALFAGIEQKHQEARNIYVVLDNAGYYRNNLVKHYVTNSKIKLLFLPPYSPNLNLIERLWKFFKKKVSNNRYYEHFADFRKTSLAFFKNLQLYESELESLLSNKFEIVKPEFAH